MTIIRKKEIKGMSETDLNKKLGELRIESIKATKHAHGTAVKTREIRRTIARILTQINQRKTKV